MTYPHFTFPPSTPLFPRHEYVQRYHRSFSDYHNLTQHVKFGHEVVGVGWIGTAVDGFWEIEVLDKSAARTLKKRVDNLINANGHNHYPFEPRLEGKQDWLKGKEGREVLHSIYFRGPERYSGLNVVVVGGGASGRDAAIQISRSAKKVKFSTYRSLYMVPDLTSTGLGLSLTEFEFHFRSHTTRHHETPNLTFQLDVDHLRGWHFNLRH